MLQKAAAPSEVSYLAYESVWFLICFIASPIASNRRLVLGKRPVSRRWGSDTMDSSPTLGKRPLPLSPRAFHVRAADQWRLRSSPTKISTELYAPMATPLPSTRLSGAFDAADTSSLAVLPAQPPSPADQWQLRGSADGEVATPDSPPAAAAAAVQHSLPTVLVNRHGSILIAGPAASSALTSVSSSSSSSSRAATPDHVPLFRGRAAVVEAMLEATVTPSTLIAEDQYVEGHGGMLLLCAAKAGAVDEARALLDAGGDVRAVRDGKNALFWACRNGFEGIATTLIERGADVSDATTLWWTCHHGASMRAVAFALLAAGARPSNAASASPARQTTALWEVCSAGGASTDAALLAIELVQCGAYAGHGELWCAARAGAAGIVRTLLATGVDVAADDAVAAVASKGGPYSGTTSLWWCCYHGLGELALDVVRRGVDPDPVAHGGTAAFDGTSALWWAASRCGDPALEDHGESLGAAVREMLDRGAVPDRVAVVGSGDGGTTPLWWAAFRARPKLARLLLSHNADPRVAVHRDEGSNCGTDALWWACYHALPDLAMRLIAPIDVDVDAVCSGSAWQGRTPLSNACRHGGAMADVALVLLKRGAKTTSTDSAGLTPLGVARMARGIDLRLHAEPATDGDGRLAALLDELERRTCIAAFGPLAEADEAAHKAAERGFPETLWQSLPGRERPMHYPVASVSIMELLTEARLSDYGPPLRASGITEVEQLLGLDAMAAAALSLKPLHFRRLTRALRERFGPSLVASATGEIGQYLAVRGMSYLAEPLRELGVELASDMADLEGCDIVSLAVSKREVNQLFCALPRELIPNAALSMVVDATALRTPQTPVRSSPHAAGLSDSKNTAAVVPPVWERMAPRIPGYVAALRRSGRHSGAMDEAVFVRSATMATALGSQGDSRSDGLLLALLFVTLDTNGTGLLPVARLERSLVAMSNADDVEAFERRLVACELELAEDAKQQEFAALRLQSIQRGRTHRQTTQKNMALIEAENDMKQQEFAALRLQAIQRGRTHRQTTAAKEAKQAALLEAENDAMQQEFAAKRLQSIQRGRTHRQSVLLQREAALALEAENDAKQQEFAALRLQSIQRGRTHRQSVMLQRETALALQVEAENDEKQQEFAAMRLQSIQRGRTHRQTVVLQRETALALEAENDAKQQEYAALRLQSIQRGRTHRQTTAAKKAALVLEAENDTKQQEFAALRLQSIQRGRRHRLAAAQKKKKVSVSQRVPAAAARVVDAVAEIAIEEKVPEEKPVPKKKKKAKKVKKVKKTTSAAAAASEFPPPPPNRVVKTVKKGKKGKKFKKKKVSEKEPMAEETKEAAAEASLSSSVKRPERVKKMKKIVRRPGKRQSLKEEIAEELKAADDAPTEEPEAEAARLEAENDAKQQEFAAMRLQSIQRGRTHRQAAAAQKKATIATEAAATSGVDASKPEHAVAAPSERAHAPTPVADASAKVEPSAAGEGTSFEPLPVCSGYLKKRKKKDNAFQNRWFVIKEGTMTFYKKDKMAGGPLKPSRSLVDTVRALRVVYIHHRPCCLLFAYTHKLLCVASSFSPTPSHTHTAR